MPNETPLGPASSAGSLMTDGRVVPHRSAARLAVLYLAVGLLWVGLTDAVLFWGGWQSLTGLAAGLSKGTLFFLLTTPAVFWLVQRDIRLVKRANALLRAVADGTTDALFVKNRDGQYLFVNAAAARFIGRRVADVLGRDDAELFDPDSARRVRAVDCAVMTAGVVSTSEEQLTLAGGARTFLATKAPYRDDQGEVIGVIGIARDITDRKQAEEALRASEERARRGEALLSAVMDALPVSVLVADEVGRLVRMNPASQRIWGPAPMSGSVDEYREWVGYWPDTGRRIEPREWPMSRAVLDGETSTGVRVVIEQFVTGGRRHLELSAAPVVNEAGTRLGGVVTCADITERVQTEADLRTSEERLRQAVSLAGVGVFDHDHGADAIYWSPELRRVFGIGPDVLARLEAYHALVHPEDGPAVASAVQGAHDPAGDGRFNVEHRIVRPTDGAVRWLIAQAQTRFEGEGADRRPARTIGAILDVTERKLADQRLRDSEERYRRLVEVLPGAVFVHTGEAVVFCNPALVRLMGAASAEEVLGLSPLDVAAPEFHPVVRERMESMRATGRPAAGVEMRVTRRDGGTVPVYSVSVPITGYGPAAYLVALSDLTERERAAELLRTVMASVNDAILTIDASGRIESSNPATERLFGYNEAELLGRNVRLLMPEPHRTQHDGYIGNYLRTGEAKVIGLGREVEGRRKDGSLFPAELTVTEYRREGTRHFTGVIRDITSRKRLEEQFRQAQKMEAVGRLAGGVAHDFNNLLTVINGYSEMLLLDLSAAGPQRAAVAAIREAGERAAALTSQLLAFSRKAIVAPKVFDLNDTVAQSERLLRRLIGEDVVLTVLPHAAPCRVNADPNQIDQVILNLAVNARDAMPTGGRLTLATRLVTDPPDAGLAARPTRFVELAATDTGCGMSDEVQARIFEPFFTTKEAGRGTGLGLATVYGIVKQAGGEITVESAVGRGTTFRVRLPETTEVRPAEAAAPARAVAGGRETVLLVEDEDGVRKLSRIALEAQGYTVVAAANGREALDLLRERPAPVDLLVTDVVMPEMSGRELADAVRAVAPATRVLFVSGYTDDAVFRHGVEEATDAFLQKPFTPLGLARKVRDVLDDRAGLR